jgi:hypothetical protein
MCILRRKLMETIQFKHKDNNRNDMVSSIGDFMAW